MQNNEIQKTIFKSGINFEYVKLNREVLNKINKDNITAVMWGGSMGDEGARYILFNDNIVAYTNMYYDENDINDEDISSVFPHFPECWMPFPSGINTGEIYDKPWIQCYLGMSFFLCMNMNSKFYFELGYKLFVSEQDESVRMRNWNILAEYCKNEVTFGIVEELSGDALKTNADILLHQVNLQGVIGAGIAKQIASTYPSLEKEYIKYPYKELGNVLFYETDKYVIGNCFSQTYDFCTDYKALEKCLDKVVEYMQLNNLKSVAIPYKYGCGIANGDWDVVKKIFILKFRNFDLKIYKLK